MDPSAHSLHRFFISSKDIRENEITIKKSDLRHIRSVLRLGKGDRIVVSDGAGWDYLVKLTGADSRKVVGEILEKEFAAEALPRVVLFQALLKGPKMDLIVQKATEIGVSEVEGVLVERTVAKIDQERAEKRAFRWRQIAEEAAKQSRRSYLPLISDVLNWQEALKRLARFDLVIVPWEGEKKTSLKDVLTDTSVKNAAVMIGPEGGFSSGEIDDLLSLGARVVTLGRQILRAETAAIATLTVVLYQFGRLGG